MAIPTAIAEKLDAKRRMPSPAACRAIRLAAGLSQADLAAPLGVHRESVARWEAGVRTPRGALLRAYVDLLDQLRAELP